MSTLIITGANGFVGGHLAAIAHDEGHQVWAVGREPDPSPAVAACADAYFSADLEHVWNLPTGADAVIHLAGLAAVGPSFDDPQRYLNVNSGIMTVMGESLLGQPNPPRVVVASSGSVYAIPAPDATVSETSPTMPSSPYAVAKLLVELQARYYATRGLDTIIARPFNHIGPAQGRGFLVPDLAASLLDLPVGHSLPVGNLDAARDYTDVRDVARAYLTLAFAPTHQHNLYNIATGSTHTGHEVLEAVVSVLGRPLPQLAIDTARLRPNDPPRITGDATRLRNEFGWAPTIDYRTSIKDFVLDGRKHPDPSVPNG